MVQAGWVKEHVDQYKNSEGAEGHLWDRASAEGSFPCLLLTTIGRMSGEPKTTPLIYGRDQENYTIIASQGGRPSHPAWYLNLVSNPKVQVQVAAEKFSGVARSTLGKERQRLWKMMMEVYPLFDNYQEKVSGVREIPLVILKRKD